MMIIRQASPNDAENILKIYSYYVINTAISFEWDVPSIDEMKSRITKTSEHYPYFVAEEDGKILGYCYAGVFKGRRSYNHSCEVSIYIDKDCRGKGIGRALYQHLENALKAIGIENAYACIASPVVKDEYLTHDSENFHKHLGYSKVGEFYKCAKKFNRYYNMIWMEKILLQH